MTSLALLLYLGGYSTNFCPGRTDWGHVKLGDQPLHNYLKSAATCLYLLTACTISILDPSTASSGKIPVLYPFIREQIAQHTACSHPQQKKEPFMYLMLTSLASYLAALRDPVSVQLSYLLANSFFNKWLCLFGTFTGLCVGKYSQSKIAKGQRYIVVPPSSDAGDWAGSSLAFL